jgi:hypothetical protein
MNEDYLWDKSGDPDPDIERLEKTLGSMRYKRPAEPLPLPATTRTPFRLSFTSPAFAIAATLVILVLAGGLWFGLRRSESTQEQSTVAAPQEKQSQQQIVSGPRPPLDPIKPTDNKVAQAKDKLAAAQSNSGKRRNKTARYSSGTAQQVLARRHEPNPSERARREQIAREGEKAKAQLIMALHITSQKLNTVQKKMQTNQERSPIS